MRGPSASTPQAEEYELLSRGPSTQGRAFHPSQPWTQRFATWLSVWLPVESANYRALNNVDNMEDDSEDFPSKPARYAENPWIRRVVWIFAAVASIVVGLVILTAIMFPSYSHPPEHYHALHERAVNSTEPGRVNIHNEKIFIASSLFDENGKLASGPWASSVLGLIDLLGPNNVFLSVYEDDPDPLANAALQEFSSKIGCNSSIVTEHIERGDLPHVKLPNGAERLKRIAFLAHARNRALAPLDDPNSAAYLVRFDKLLHINDVVFDSIDAANLIFSTNVDDNGKAQYRGACAMDFVNPFKFYDTFATRDLEGHELGVSIFPWFSKAGKADSRRDVLDQRDAVRVRSCWGGMAVFDARWLQPDESDTSLEKTDSGVEHNGFPSESATTSMPSRPSRLSTTTASSPTSAVDFHPEVDANLNWGLTNPFGSGPPSSNAHRSRSPNSNVSTPVRFRASSDTFWDASECCLLHADIQEPRTSNISASTGVYMNPYIRVAYSSRVLALLPITRRMERFFTPMQALLSAALRLPKPNPRRTEEAGREVVNRVWEYDDPKWMVTGNLSGGYKDVRRIALPGGFCGSEELIVLGEGKEMRDWWYEDVPKDKESRK